MGATKTLAQFIVDTSYENLPAPVVEAAKVAILDGVANMLAGFQLSLDSRRNRLSWNLPANGN